MKAMQHIAIAGATGRMGKMLLEAVFRSPDMILHAALEREGHPAIGRDVGEIIGEKLNTPIQVDTLAALKGADCLIDFTQPEVTMQHLDACRESGIALVIGTTGFTPEQKQKIEQTARQIPIVFSPNMSVGVNVLYRLIAQAAEILGDDYDIEIIEAHHRHKVDAPSGTALKMGQVAAKALDRDFEKYAQFDRQGITGERSRKTIGFSAIRGGDIVGDHTIMFADVGERIEITHKSSSRATYAEGAIRAARFLGGKTSGLYDMEEVLFGETREACDAPAAKPRICC